MSINYVLISISALLGACAQLLMKQGVNKIGELSLKVNSIDVNNSMIGTIFDIIRSPFIMSGLFLYGMSTLIWLKVLSSTKELGAAYPLLSISYIAVIILSYIFLKETITINKIIGSLVIILGIFIITK